MTASRIATSVSPYPPTSRWLVWSLLLVATSGCATQRSLLPSLPAWLGGSQAALIDEPEAIFSGDGSPPTQRGNIQLTAAQEAREQDSGATDAENLPVSPPAFAPPVDQAPPVELVPPRSDVDDALRAVEREAEEDEAALGQDADRPGAKKILELLPSPSTRNDAGQTLALEDVLAAVADSYPLLEVALAELAAADGKALAPWGNFDTLLFGDSISQPIGFYENYRNRIVVRQPLWNGGELYSGYRIGRGEFEPWYRERQTNDGGELKTGFKLPLLKDRAIDQRRTEVATARLRRLALGPNVQTRIIGFQLGASLLYWQWVAAGQVVLTQQELLRLAEERNRSLAIQVAEGDLPKITEIDNGRFIAQRRAKLLEAERKLQQAAIKLSLFYRNETGQPVVADDLQLPEDFPEAKMLESLVVEADVARAFTARPELRELDFMRQEVSVELSYAQNQYLPKVNALAEMGQDVGGAATSSRDKAELEMDVGFIVEVPLQRRMAAGKIQAAQAKLGEIAAKQQFMEDKIRASAGRRVGGQFCLEGNRAKSRERYLNQEGPLPGEGGFR